jgi:hypothetical protein
MITMMIITMKIRIMNLVSEGLAAIVVLVAITPIIIDLFIV